MLTETGGRLLTFMKGPARLKELAPQPLRILIVDDEEPVRRFVERVLRDAGYATTLAADGPEAIAAADKMEQIDILVTDVMMPAMQGDELRAAAAVAPLAESPFHGLQRSAVQGKGHAVGGRSVPGQAVQRKGCAGGVAGAVRSFVRADVRTS